MHIRKCKCWNIYAEALLFINWNTHRKFSPFYSMRSFHLLFAFGNGPHLSSYFYFSLSSFCFLFYFFHVYPNHLLSIPSNILPSALIFFSSWTRIYISFFFFWSLLSLLILSSFPSPQPPWLWLSASTDRVCMKIALPAWRFENSVLGIIRETQKSNTIYYSPKRAGRCVLYSRPLDKDSIFHPALL